MYMHENRENIQGFHEYRIPILLLTQYYTWD